MPIVPIHFDAAIVGRRDGSVSIALLVGLPEPHAEARACVAILECSGDVAAALCRDLSFQLSAAKNAD